MPALAREPCAAGWRATLVVVFSERTSLGVVRLRAIKAKAALVGPDRARRRFRWRRKRIDRARHRNDANNAARPSLISLWGDEVVRDDTRKAQYLTNLERLGIIRIDFDSFSDTPEAAAAYMELGDRTRARLAPREGWMVVSRKGMALFTPFGRQFWHACMRPGGARQE